MKYKYRVIGDLSESKPFITINLNRVPSYDAYIQVEEIIRKQFKDYEIGTIQHSRQNVGTVEINSKKLS